MCCVRLGNTAELQHEPILFPEGVNTLLKVKVRTFKQAKWFIPTVRITGLPDGESYNSHASIHEHRSGFVVRAMTTVLKKTNQTNEKTPKHLTHFSSYLQQWPAPAPQRNPPQQWDQSLLRDSHQLGTQRLFLERKEKGNLKTSVGKVNPSPISVTASTALVLFPARAGSCEWNRHLTDPSRGFLAAAGITPGMNNMDNLAAWQEKHCNARTLT